MSSELLLSLTASMARHAQTQRFFGACDPVGIPLGSGGGSIHLLTEAWRANSHKQTFREWLRQSRKLLVHTGGQSRRLPSYAPAGNAFIPMPVWRWSRGQRLDQTLLDLQVPVYESLLTQAPARTAALVASGDVLLRFGGQLPTIPDADVVIVGMWVRPELASRHGVLFCPRGEPNRLAFMLQKPAPERIRELSAENVFLIDTGAWLLSERAIETLRAQCRHGETYDLYGDFGLSLGQWPTERNRSIHSLSCAVLPLPHGEFYHFGNNRSVIESVSALQNRIVDQTKFGSITAKPHPDQYTQNSVIKTTITPANRTLWIENSCVPATWQLASENMLTGVPNNHWKLRLAPGACLDFVPLDAHRVCVRNYRFDDAFRGPVDPKIALMLNIAATTDWQQAPLFPVLETKLLDPRFIQWLVDNRPPHEPFQKLWRATPRLSAQDLLRQADLPRLERQRQRNRETILLPMARNHQLSVFYNLDLEATAKLFASARFPLPATASNDSLKRGQELMFGSAVKRARREHGAEPLERAAFSQLRQTIIAKTELRPVLPTRRVLDDQIVWGRAPVRLDLAGGWTDTPPYCFQHGGQVVNLAVNLNGQPPIQVFARIHDRPELVVRSIDLGLEERIRSYTDLGRYNRVGSGFSLDRDAFALAGFHPQFNPAGCRRTLEKQLRSFGGGIEISLLCAVPKGSGLGTSSILAATLLGTLSNFCGLDWDLAEMSQRTLTLEQMLTTGGGWQDQVGGLLPGVKLIETEAGLLQKPVVRWLPEQFFTGTQVNTTVLLYYTGITRVAKRILQEIVCGMFLNSHRHLAVLEEIGANAYFTCDAIQRNDWTALGEAVRRSWQLNQRLDRGTNPPVVQAILAPITDYLSAAKLLGAGGGGYLLLFAKDDAAARRIRETLEKNPPNSKARFVNLSLSDTGLQVTRS